MSRVPSRKIIDRRPFAKREASLRANVSLRPTPVPRPPQAVRTVFKERDDQPGQLFRRILSVSVKGADQAVPGSKHAGMEVLPMPGGPVVTQHPQHRYLQQRSVEKIGHSIVRTVIHHYDLEGSDRRHAVDDSVNHARMLAASFRQERRPMPLCRPLKQPCFLGMVAPCVFRTNPHIPSADGSTSKEHSTGRDHKYAQITLANSRQPFFMDQSHQLEWDSGVERGCTIMGKSSEILPPLRAFLTF